MADTLNVFGHPVKKTTAAFFGVAAVGVAGYGLYKSRQDKAAAAAPATASSAAAGTAAYGDEYPADGTVGNPSDPYSTDPATSQTYGDESSGYGAVTGYGDTSGAGDVGYYGTPTGYGAQPGPGYFTSNAQWAQYVEQYMGSSGDDSISAAVGKYITGQPVTTDQVSIIEQAIAIGGYPPIAGTGGYPPSISTGGTGGGTTTTTTGTGTGTGTGTTTTTTPPPAAAKVTVPSVTGAWVAHAGGAEDTLTAAGLTYKTSPAVNPKNTYKVSSQSPKAGTSVARGSRVTLTIKIAQAGK